MSIFAKSFIVFYALMLFAYASIPGISVRDTKKLIDSKKAIIIDVREPIELKNGMVKGAILLPLSKMSDDRIFFDHEVDSIPKDKTIIVYCVSGRRAGIVGAALEKKGYKVLNMGKFSSWKDAGLPIEIKE